MKLYEFMMIDEFDYDLDKIFELAKDSIERRNPWEPPFKDGWEHGVTFMGKDENNASKWLVEVFGEYDETAALNQQEAMEKAALENMANFGPAETIIDSETGEYIMLNGQITEFGLKILRERT